MLALLGVTEPFDPHHRLVSSPVHSLRILTLRRLILAVYGCATIITSLVYESTVLHQGNIWFSYFTHLTFIGLTAYLLVSSYHCLNYKPSPFTVYAYPLQRWPKALQALHMFLMSTVVTFPILVTIAYWGLIASSNTFATPYASWTAISLHILNTVVALLEITTTNIPPLPWMQLLLCLVTLAGYLGVAYITHATQGVYTYTFLDPQIQHKKLAAYIVGIAIAEALIFILVRYAIVLRDKLSKFSLYHDQGEEREELDEWQDVPRDDAEMREHDGISSGNSSKAMKQVPVANNS